MPLYEYQCETCHHQFEVRQKISDPVIDKCIQCGHAVRKLISASGIMFKGTGWYVTDYSNKMKDPSQDKMKDPSQDKMKDPSQDKMKDQSESQAKDGAGSGSEKTPAKSESGSTPDTSSSSPTSPPSSPAPSNSGSSSDSTT